MTGSRRSRRLRLPASRRTVLAALAVLAAAVVMVLASSLSRQLNGSAVADGARPQAATGDLAISPAGVASQSPTQNEGGLATQPAAGGSAVTFAPVPGGVYYVDPSREEPEVVARDKRGAQMVWPAMGNISTYFHESGPYWVGGYHQGLDIASHWGWNVFAAWDGVVVEVATGWNRGYGNSIVIDHRNGIQTRYAHLAHQFVEVGDRVEYGKLIGLVGSTGAAEGPHLHFEVIVDEQQRDPLLYLPEDPEREYVG